MFGTAGSAETAAFLPAGQRRGRPPALRPTDAEDPPGGLLGPLGERGAGPTALRATLAHPPLPPPAAHLRAPRPGGAPLRRPAGGRVGRSGAPQNSSSPPPARTAGRPQTPPAAALYPPAAPTAAARCPKSTRRDSSPPPAPSALPPAAKPHPGGAASPPRAVPPHLQQRESRSPRPRPFRQRSAAQPPPPRNTPLREASAGAAGGERWVRGAPGALPPCSSRDALKSEGRRWLKREVFSPPSNSLGQRVALNSLPRGESKGTVGAATEKTAPLGEPVSG